MKKYRYLITGDDIQTMGLTLIPGKVAPSGKKFLTMEEITSVYYAKVDLPTGSDKRLVTYERVSSSITLTAEPSQLSFNYARGSKTVRINTNADYSLIRVLSSDPDRFATSLEGNVLTVTVPQNDSENNYNGGIQITVGDKSITVSVSQSGSVYERFLECSVGDKYDFEASGGLVNLVYTLITYKNGEEYSRESVIPTDYEYTPVDGFSVNTGDRSVTASNRGTTIGSERSLYLTAIYQGSNFQVSTQTKFVQEANVIEDVLYGEWEISLTADKYTSSSSPAPASRAQSTITATATRTKTNVYTSGATQGLPNENATPSLSVSGTGFTLSGNVVTIADRTNVEGAQRTGVVTATYGGKSKTLNLYQAENKIVGVGATGTVTSGRGTLLSIYASGGEVTWSPVVEYSSGWNGTPPSGVIITYSLSNTDLGATQDGNVTTWPNRGITIGAWRGVNVNIHASSSYTTTPVLGTVSTGQNLNGITSIDIRACGGAVDPPQTNYPASRESHCFSFRCFFSSGSDAEISAIDGLETWSFNQSWGSWAPTSENRWWGNLTVSSRGTTIGNARTGTLTCTVKGTINGVSINVSDSVTITQAANLVTELRPTPQGFRYNNIGAGDTTATPTSITPGANSVVYVFSSGATSSAMPGDSYGSFTSREEYSLGTVQNGFTAVNRSTGVLTATNRSYILGPDRVSGVVTKKYICTWTHSSTYGGSTVSGTGSTTATCTQGANIVVSLVVVNVSGNTPTTSFPAKGNTGYNYHGKSTYSSGSVQLSGINAEQYSYELTSSAGFSKVDASNKSFTTVRVENRGTTIGSARSAVLTVKFTNPSYTGYNNVVSGSVTLTQEANSVTYTAPIMTYTKSVIPASGGTGSVRMTFKSTATYTSGVKESVSSSPDPNGQDAVHRAWRPTDINPWMAEGYIYGGLSPYNYPNVTQDETTCTLSYVDGGNPFSNVGRIVRMKCTAPPKSGAGNVLYCGGIRYNFSTSEVGNYYWHLIIKLPVGYRAWFSYNSLGTGGNASFLNGGIPVGTGDWQAVYGRYVIGEGGNTLNLYIVVCRDSSTPAPTASNPAILDVAYSAVTRLYSGSPNPLYFTNKGVFTYPSLGLQPTLYAQPINNSTTNDTVVKNRDFAPMLYWNVYGFTYYFCMFVPQDRNIITSCKVGGNADNTRYTYGAPSSPVSAGSSWYHIGLWAVMSSGKSGYLDNDYYSSASNQTSWATIGTSGAGYNFFHKLNIASRGLIEGDARSVIITLATLNTKINATYAKSATYTIQQSANVATYGLPWFKSWIQKGIIPASGGSSQSRSLVYTQPVTYSSGDNKIVTTGATVSQESYWGRIDGPQVNAMPVYDLFFETTSYLISLYNNAHNGVTTLTRVYAYPGGDDTFGSRYEIQVKNTGLGQPGLGGFYIHINHPSGLPSGTSFMLTLMCKIPSGYTINCATNSLGTGGKITWYSSQRGDGNFRSYSLGITLGTGYMSGVLFYMWFSGTAGTPSSPKLVCQLLSAIEVSNQDANLGVGRGGATYSGTEGVFKLPSLGTLVQPLGAERYNRTVWLTFLLNGVKFGNLLYPVQAANVASAEAWVPQAVFNTPVGSYTIDYHDQYIPYTKEATRKTTYTSGSVTKETATDTANIKLTSNQSWCVVAATFLGFTENNTGADRQVTIGVSYGGVTTNYTLTQLKKDVGNISLQIVNNTREYISLFSEGYTYIGWEGSSPRGDWHFENLECDAYNTITYDGIGNVDFSTASSDYVATAIFFNLPYLRSYLNSGTILQTFAYKLEFLLSTDGTTNWYNTSLASGNTNSSVGSTGNLPLGGVGVTIPAHTSPNSIRIVLKITINSAG
jgi:hypothetical protein